MEPFPSFPEPVVLPTVHPADDVQAANALKVQTFRTNSQGKVLRLQLDNLSPISQLPAEILVEIFFYWWLECRVSVDRRYV